LASCSGAAIEYLDRFLSPYPTLPYPTLPESRHEQRRQIGAMNPAQVIGAYRFPLRAIVGQQPQQRGDPKVRTVPRDQRAQAVAPCPLAPAARDPRQATVMLMPAAQNIIRRLGLSHCHPRTKEPPPVSKSTRLVPSRCR
jgi:hypothetical protein